jgi:hypothetical protein
MKKSENQKNLSLKTETVRSLSADEMKDINGGFKHSSCWTVVVPSSGLAVTIAITLDAC